MESPVLSTMHLYLLAACAVLHSSLTVANAAQQCENTIDDSFFNKCRIDIPAGVPTAIAQTVTNWINPMLLSTTGTSVVLLMPLLLLFGRKMRVAMLSEATINYHYYQLMALNFVHRIGYTMALNVALYAVFRQHRPCSCSAGTGPGVQKGCKSTLRSTF